MTAREVLEERYADLEANVIGIANRRHIMWATDMVYHSPLCFDFQGRRIEKGVAELLIVGDTRTGKTHTVRNLMKHYGLGDFFSAESVSLAGLLGGVDETGGKRFVRMGRLPMNHKRLVVIDEASDLSEELVSQLSGVRSSGSYDMVKIINQRIPCLARMIWISNTRSGRPINEFSYGVEAVKDVIPKAEDVARFDIAICVSSSDVNLEDLRKPVADKLKVPQRYTSDVCRERVTWAWSRQPEDISFEDGCEEKILEWSQRLAELYHESVPLMIETEARIKIARLALSTAALCFSTDESHRKLICYPRHVDCACEMLQETYRMRTTAYEQFSESARGKELGGDVRRIIYALGRNSLKKMLAMTSISRQDFRYLLDSDKEVCEEVFYRLLKENAAVKSGSGLRFSEPMIERVKEVVQSDEDLPENPSKNRLGLNFLDTMPAVLAAPEEQSENVVEWEEDEDL